MIKKILIGMPLLLSVATLSTFASNIENSMTVDFYSAAKKIEGKFFSGLDQDGNTCHILVKELVSGNTEGMIPIRLHKKINLLVTSEKLTDELLVAKTDSEFDQIMAENYGAYTPYAFDFERRKAGWCSNCGSANYDGRVRSRGKILGFYAQGFTPSKDSARIYLSKDGKSIKKVKLIGYKDWYIPLVNFSPKSDKTVCNINK